MKQKLVAALLALSLTLALAACGGGGSGADQVPPPISAPAGAPEPEILAEDPAPAEEGLLTAREMAMGGVVECVDLSCGKGLFIESYTREYTPGSRNIRELNLDTGAERELPLWADNGLCRWNGESYFWVALDDEPVERTAASFGPGAAEVRWEDYAQEGIRRGDGTGEGELIYALPRRAGELRDNDITYPWNGEERHITALAAGENFLAWVEVWSTANEELGDFFVYELWAMDLGTGNARRYVIGGTDDPEQDRLWMDGDRMVFAGFQTGFPCSPYLCDLSGGGLLLLDSPVIFDLQDMALEGDLLAWGRRYWAVNKNSAAGPAPTFALLDLSGGEPREVEVPRQPASSEDRELCEHIGGLGLFGGRYLLYSLWAGDQTGGGVRLYDLKAGEVVYRSEQDDSLANKGRAYDMNALMAERGGNGALLISGREGEQTIVTLFRVNVPDPPVESAPEPTAPASSQPEESAPEPAPASSRPAEPASEPAPALPEQKPIPVYIRMSSDNGQNPDTDAAAEAPPMAELWRRNSEIRSYFGSCGLTREDFGSLYAEEAGGRFTLTITSANDEAVDRALAGCPAGLVDEVVRTPAPCSRAQIDRFSAAVQALPRQEGEFAIAFSHQWEDVITIVFSPSARERLEPEIARLLAEEGIPEEILVWEMRDDVSVDNPDT